MRKIITFGAFLLLALALMIPLAGCSDDDGGNSAEISEATLIEKVISSSANIETCQFTMQMTMDISSKGDGESLDMNLSYGGTGKIDNANQQMEMKMNVDMDMNMLGMDMDQDMDMEMYFIGNMMYMMTSSDLMGSEWTKSSLPEETGWESQDLVAQQTELLQGASLDISDGGMVNGVSCYKVEIIPNMLTLYETLMQQPGMSTEGLPEGMNITDLMDMIKEIGVTQWYAKDTFFPMKSDMSMTMVMNSEDMDPSGMMGDMEMGMDMTMNMEFSNYNEPVSIELPPEAANAVEIDMDDDWDDDWDWE
jgi:hypothetical protein